MLTAIFLLMLCLPFISDSTTTPKTESNWYEKKLDAGIEAFYQTDWDSAGRIFDDLKM